MFPSEPMAVGFQSRLWFKFDPGNEPVGFMGNADIRGRTDLHPALPKNDNRVEQLWPFTHMGKHRTNKVPKMLKHALAMQKTFIGF